MACWYVCGGVRSGHWKWWGELRKDEGEEECRGEESINKLRELSMSPPPLKF